MKRFLIVLLSFGFLFFTKSQNLSYTFQVNQTCTSCCTATACINWTWTICPSTPLNYTILTPSSPGAFTFTSNPCFYNLCNGTYTAVINGASSSSCGLCGIGVTYPSSAALNEIDSEEPSLHIYPNPAKDKISIKSNTDLDNLDLRIVNLLGQIERTIENSASRQYIITGFKPGIYFVVLRKNEIIVARKKLIVSD